MVQKKVGLGKVVHSREALDLARELISQGRTTEGEWTTRFENELAAYAGFRHAIATSSGTGALWCIFSQLRAKELTTTPMTFAATANAPESLGWKVRYADINSDDYGLARQPDGFTLTVHLFGYPSRVAGDVADACEAVGSALPKPFIASAVSFYPSHTIGVGELGAVLTDNLKLARSVRLAKDNGRDRNSSDVYTKFRRVTMGLNFKASEVNCALALYQLADAEKMVRARQEVVKAYLDLFPFSLEKGKYDPYCAYLGYPVVFASAAQKVRVTSSLERGAVEYRCMFPLLGGFDVPEARRISTLGIYLPSHSLMEDEEVHRVADAIRQGMKK